MTVNGAISREIRLGGEFTRDLRKSEREEVGSETSPLACALCLVKEKGQITPQKAEGIRMPR